MRHSSDWNDKYRPSCLEDFVLRPTVKAYLRKFERTGTFPNLLFVGSPGTGKTTAGRFLCSLPGIASRMVNLVTGQPKDMGESLTWTKHFLYGGVIKETAFERKNITQRAIFIDEAQLLKTEHIEIIKQWIEADVVYATFVLAVNDVKKLTPALCSRLVTIDFEPRVAEYRELIEQAAHRCRVIAKAENLVLSDDDALSIARATYPDMRKMLNELYKASLLA